MRKRRHLRSGRTGLGAGGRCRTVEAARPVDPAPEVGLGALPYRALWCRIAGGAPADPPDERYFADEVRPTGVDGSGHMQWQTVSGGLTGIVIHNVAEAAGGTHLVAQGTVVRVEERLDRGSPPGFIYLTFATVPPAGDRLARIVSCQGDTYTVQPVLRGAGGFTDDGPAIAGVPNIGELWTDEKGYLAGPTGFDRYVRLLNTPAGWTILLHPPRMV